MAAPNLRVPTTITGKTAVAALTTSLAAVVTNSSASGKVYKLNAIRAANVSGGTVSVDIAIERSGVATYVIKAGALDTGKSLIVTDKNEYIYLEEGDVLKAKASANSSIDLSINYEEIS